MDSDSEAAAPSFTEIVIPELDLGDLEVKLKKKRPVPLGMPAVPFLGGIFGSRGSGKTTTFIKLARLYDTTHSFDKVIVFSPTLKNDEKQEALKKGMRFKCHVIDGFSDVEFGNFVMDADKELKQFERFDKAKDAYTKFKGGAPIETMEREELEHLHYYDFRDPADTGSFPHGRPSILMVFDDLVGDRRVYAENMSNTVCRFALRHRHYNTSILFLAQTFAKGIPRQIRNNVSIAIMFSNKSLTMKKQMADEMSSFMEPEAFLHMWDHATADLHDFFMVDYDAHDKELKFRKNFNVLLQPNQASMIGGGTGGGSNNKKLGNLVGKISDAATRNLNKRPSEKEIEKEKTRPHPSTLVYGKDRPVGAGGVKGASKLGADPLFGGKLGRKRKQKA
jgi:Zonular occludens toxin (Zot)